MVLTTTVKFEKTGFQKNTKIELGKIEKDKIVLKKFLQCCIYRTLPLLQKYLQIIKADV